jgi:acyl transferase domain-containing protein
MIALKPLAQALADGDRVYAIVRGTALNQDGRTPGMTVPSQEAQEALLHDACRDARVEPSAIQSVEAHGTGTRVGDPIEARALGQVLSDGRRDDQPCVIGSVKTNIGHLEAAAGIAGLIKVALALHHRQIPGNLHFDRPNPDIDWSALRLRVPTRSEPWPAGLGPALAGVNAFGFGGTNAHVILQEALGVKASSTPLSGAANPRAGIVGRMDPLPLRNPGVGNGSPRALAAATADLPRSPLRSKSGVVKWPGARAWLAPVSARGSDALRAVARSWDEFLARCPDDVLLEEIVANAALRRTHHDHRLAVVAHSKEKLAARLREIADGQAVAGVVEGRSLADRRPRLAFVCAGQGPQWWAMGRQLLREEPTFRAALERSTAIVRRLGGWSVLEELAADERHSRMDNTAVAQPCIFALQVAPAELWASWGVWPEVLVGHSVGEVAAAYLSGVFSLDDAIRIIYHRGRLMELAPDRGRMRRQPIARGSPAAHHRVWRPRRLGRREQPKLGHALRRT